MGRGRHRRRRSLLISLCEIAVHKSYRFHFAEAFMVLSGSHLKTT